MTLKERNEIKDKERIKQFLENTMRKLCDDMSDNDNLGVTAIKEATDIMLKLSNSYKNMGFDKNVDKDKIVEALKTDSSVKLYGSGNSNNYLISLEKAIEIVKVGGNVELSEHSKSQGDRTGEQKATIEAKPKAE